MISIKSLLIVLLIGTLFLGCNRSKEINNTDYPMHGKILRYDSYGRSMDSTDLYFPAEFFKYSMFFIEEVEKQKMEKEISLDEYTNRINDLYKLDREIVARDSKILYRFKEPILSSRYMGYDTYRVLIALSGPAPFTIRMIHKEKNIELIVKDGSVEYPYDIPNLRLEQNIYCQESVWDTLGVLAKKVKYLKDSEKIKNDIYPDGFSWLLEINNRDGYQVIRRHDVDESSREASLIMIYMLKCAGIEHMFGEGTDFKPAELFNKIVKEEEIIFN